MNRGSILFLKAVLVLAGIATLALLLLEPHGEGRNAHASLFQTYFNDPFLAYAYIGSIPFFMALYQAFKVLGYVGHNKVFSPVAVRALRTMRYCAMAIIGFVVVGEILLLSAESDDRAGAVFIGILIAFPSAVIATAMALLERILQNPVDLRSETDLTV
jgi:Protein of unknown function (DUF2975)